MINKGKRKYKFIDLFSGIGGFHLAAENYGKRSKKEFELVLASEIDDKAKEVYEYNFNWPKEKIKNIREIDENKIDDFDILFAGFPCQTFSNAGSKLGFKDETKGTLFFDIKRILEVKKPKYFILENVKHLYRHDNGKTYEIIKKTLKNLGYAINEEPLIINSRDFETFQNRERIYILGIKDEENFKKEINVSKLKTEIQQESKQNKNSKNFVFDNNPHEVFLLENNENKKEKELFKVFKAWNAFLQGVTLPPNRTLPVIWVDAFSKTMKERENITNNSLIPDWKKKYYKDMFYIYDTNRIFIDKWLKEYKVYDWPKKRDKKFEWQTGITDREEMRIENGYVQLRQSGIRVRKRELFPTLVAIVQTSLIFDENKWRYLTTNETKKLQTFRFKDKDGNEDNERQFKSYDEIKGTVKPYVNRHTSYKQFGNAVTVEVIEKLIQFLLEEV